MQLQSKVKLELRIDWSEMDLFGHVNNISIMKYVQAARVNYLELIGLMPIPAEIRTGPILASSACQFRKPLFYPGQLTIYSKVADIKSTSFVMQHLIVNHKNETIAEAQDVLVLYDFDKNTKLILPESVKAKIRELEKGD